MSALSGGIPPPPPPPPKTPEYGWIITEKETEVEDSSPENGTIGDVERRGYQNERVIEQTLPKGCILNVKGPSVPFDRQREDLPTTSPCQIDIYRIQIYPGMSAEILSRCVSQAVSQGRQEMMAGLFGEQDRIFHSFEYILSLPDPSWQSYSMWKPPPPRVEPGHLNSTGLVQWLYFGVSVAIFAVLVTCSCSPRYVETVFVALQGTLLGGIIVVHDWLFNLPFRELYRDGPHIIGWEGLPLAEICNRITHFGGRDFWARNLIECEEIYFRKEEAFLRTMRPMAYGILGILVFCIVRHLVVVYGESKRSRTDRAVIEAFQAFQTLVRIASRQNGAGNYMDRPRR